MKPVYFYSILLLFSFSISAFSQITEPYIKNVVEKHKPGEHNNIKTTKLYTDGNMKGSNIEIVAYKYQDKKAMVIGIEQLNTWKKKSDSTFVTERDSNFLEVSIEQSQTMLNKISELKEKAKSEKLGLDEKHYFDYTISKDLFMSFKYTRNSSYGTYVNLWIKGNKYDIRTTTFIAFLEEFLKW